MNSKHILSHFDEALDSAMKKAVLLGLDIHRSLVMIYKLIDTKNRVWSDRVIAGLDALVLQEKACIIACHDILGRFHPVANDLKFVVSLIRCGEKFGEAVGQLGVLAKGGRAVIDGGGAHDPGLLRLVDMACNEFERAVVALEYRDKDIAAKVRKEDRKLDSYHRSLVDELVQRSDGPVDIDRLFFIKAIERIADDAKGVAKAVLWM